VRDEADARSRALLDLGRVPVRADRVRREVLEHEPACELGFSARPAPDTPDFASTTTAPSSAPQRPSASSAAVA
jgi:hypothetical protein